VARRSDFQATPFARTLTAHICSWRRGYDGSSHPMFAAWSDGIYPELRAAAVAAVEADDVNLHDYASAVTSSQMFALNLFLPFREGRRDTLAARLAPCLGTSFTIDRISFEWEPPGGLLGEIDGDRPRPGEPATAVDVVLWGHGPDDAPAAVLLEVKLTEDGFTQCGGRESPANKRRDVCASAATFFADPTACYLQRPRGKTRDRRYWSIFADAHGSVRAAFPGALLDGACPFAGHAQQPMRNLALARALEQDATVIRAWFGLCAHDDNPDVTEHWASWRDLLPDPAMAPVLPAFAVLAAGRDAGHEAWAAWMSDRYRLRAAE
jgi:hypothetical protein